MEVIRIKAMEKPSRVENPRPIIIFCQPDHNSAPDPATTRVAPAIPETSPWEILMGIPSMVAAAPHVAIDSTAAAMTDNPIEIGRIIPAPMVAATAVP